MPIDAMLRRTEVQRMTGLSCAGIYKMMRANRFPEPIKVTSRAVRWPKSEIDAWLADRPRATGENKRAA